MPHPTATTLPPLSSICPQNQVAAHPCSSRSKPATSKPSCHARFTSKPLVERPWIALVASANVQNLKTPPLHIIHVNSLPLADCIAVWIPPLFGRIAVGYGLVQDCFVRFDISFGFRLLLTLPCRSLPCHRRAQHRMTRFTTCKTSFTSDCSRFPMLLSPRP